MSEDRCPTCEDRCPTCGRLLPGHGVRRGVKPIVHGTNAGYQQHRRKGEEPCDKCRRAHASYVKRWRKR